MFDETILITVGDFFRTSRIVRGLTQEQLAQNAGVSKNTVARLENGLGGNLTAWLRLAVALGYEKDLLSVLSKPKVTTIADHQKLGQGKFEGRLRVRKSKGENSDA